MKTRMNPGRLHTRWRPALALISVSFLVYSAHAATDDAFTPAQVQAGAQIFSDHCAKCHGESLGGKDGPPLVGADFASTLEFGHMTTPLLYTFISQAMPADNPGSLNQTDYLAVLSFILSKNGYKPGTIPLTQSRLVQIKLLPLPVTGTHAAR